MIISSSASDSASASASACSSSSSSILWFNVSLCCCVFVGTWENWDACSRSCLWCPRGT